MAPAGPAPFFFHWMVVLPRRIHQDSVAPALRTARGWKRWWERRRHPIEQRLLRLGGVRPNRLTFRTARFLLPVGADKRTEPARRGIRVGEFVVLGHGKGVFAKGVLESTGLVGEIVTISAESPSRRMSVSEGLSGPSATSRAYRRAARRSCSCYPVPGWRWSRFRHPNRRGLRGGGTGAVVPNA